MPLTVHDTFASRWVLNIANTYQHVSECCAITQKRCPPKVKDKEKVMFRSSRRISHGTDLRQSEKYDYTASCEVHAATSIDLSSD